jgi:hypothetical protein
MCASDIITSDIDTSVCQSRCVCTSVMRACVGGETCVCRRCVRRLCASDVCASDVSVCEDIIDGDVCARKC